MLLTAEQYFESRRKEIDKYVEGEHKWLGCTDGMPSLSCYTDPLPWYLNGTPKDTIHYTR